MITALIIFFAAWGLLEAGARCLTARDRLNAIIAEENARLEVEALTL